MSVQFVQLSEVANIERNGVNPSQIEDGMLYVGLEHIEAGGRLLDIKPVASGELASTKFGFGPEHVLYGKLRPYLAKIATPDFRGICSTDILPILPGPRLDRSYLTHFLRQPAMVDYAASRSEGVNLPRLSPKTLAKFEIPLPPLDEQKRIASILDKADQLRQKRRQAIALLDSLTQSIFLDMFGDPDQNPLRLEYVPLKELVDPKDRLNYGVVQPGEDVEDGVPLIRVSDLGEGVVDRSELRLIDPHISRKHGKSVLKGTEILISCVGSIGEIALASDADKGSNIARAVARVPLCEGINREFVAAYLRTEKVKRYFTKELRTSSQPTLNIKQISETLVPKISDDQAVEFENRVRYTQKLKSLGKIHDGQVGSLFASLQHRAFAGQL